VSTRTPSHRPHVWLVVAAVLCGAGTSLQARMNAGLAADWHSGWTAAVWSIASGAAVLWLAVVVTRDGRASVGRLAVAVRGGGVKWWAFTGGLVGALFVASQGFAAGIIGIALFTVAYVAGQSIGGLAIDRRGLGPIPPKPITAARILGTLLAIVAVAVAAWSHLSLGGPIWAYLLPFVAGMAFGWQQGVNNILRHASGNGITATGVNFLVATIVLGFIALCMLPFSGLPTAWPTEWWYLLGGVTGAAFIFTQTMIVHRLGVLLLGLGLIAGQLIASTVLDATVPVPGHALGWETIAGTAIALVAVIVAAIPGRRRRV